MKEAIVRKGRCSFTFVRRVEGLVLTHIAGPTVDVIDSPIPKPKADELLIKVLVSGSNPKDWKVPEWLGGESNQGDDIAGVVHEVGADVYEFKAGKASRGSAATVGGDGDGHG